jgi:hypothetical protein
MAVTRISFAGAVENRTPGENRGIQYALKMGKKPAKREFPLAQKGVLSPDRQ